MARNIYIDRDLKILSEMDNYITLQQKWIKPHLGKRILEVGAGIGTHTSFLLKQNNEWLGALEVDPDFCVQLKDRFHEKIEVINTDIMSVDDPKLGLYDRQIDTIVVLNVLEHIENDVECLRKLKYILKPGGRIIMINPAIHFLFSPLDRIYGHYRRYTRNDIFRMANFLELKVIQNTYFNMIGFIGWLIVAKLFRSNKITFGTHFFNSIILNLDRMERRINNIPFGLSLLTVLFKDIT